MNVLSLFAGIDLGLQRAGMRIVGQVEIDPYCRAVLAALTDALNDPTTTDRPGRAS